MVKKLLDEEHKNLVEKLSSLAAKEDVSNLSIDVNDLVKENLAMKKEIKRLKKKMPH